MSISESFRPTNAAPSQPPLAWPVVGGRGHVSGNSAGADDDLRALQRIGTKVRIGRDTAIFSQGEPAAYVYKVVSGVVRLCRHMPGGRRHIAQFSFPGEFFGIMDLDAHSFTAEAVADVVVIRYEQRELAALGEERLSVRRRFLTLLSQRLRDMENHLTVLGRQTAKERVVSFLLSLAERIGIDDDDLVDVPMSRQDMADYLGLTNETVSRVVTELKRAGLVETPNHRQFILNDSDALQALADGDEEFAPSPQNGASVGQSKGVLASPVS
ncbi:MAG TPA: helix-turn-helix domain-containing protein [Micropepsaceae bacterium]|nr:helix-turn-helix domain-containing protein [Micropepsaceae bacterium]